MVAQLRKILGDNVSSQLLVPRTLKYTMYTMKSPIIENYLIQIIHKNQITRKTYIKIKSRIREISKMLERPIHRIILENHLDAVNVSLFSLGKKLSSSFDKMTCQKKSIGGQNANGNDTDINLFTNIQYDEMKALVRESYYCALLDSGCTQTVSGELVQR